MNLRINREITFTAIIQAVVLALAIVGGYIHLHATVAGGVQEIVAIKERLKLLEEHNILLKVNEAELRDIKDQLMQVNARLQSIEVTLRKK